MKKYSGIGIAPVPESVLENRFVSAEKADKMQSIVCKDHQ